MKKIILLILFSAMLLICPLLSCAEEVPVDTRIAMIRTRFKCGCETSKAGVMISRDGMITTSSALYCSEHGQEYEDISFCFGYVGGQCVYTYTGGFRFHAYETFLDGFDSENDIAYIRFAKPVGEQTGWYVCKAVSENSLQSGIQLVYRCNTENGCKDTMISTFTIEDKKFLSFPIAEGIDSGIPAFITDQGGAPTKLIGIINSCAENETNRLSYIRRITSRIYNDMIIDGLIDNWSTGKEPLTAVFDPETVSENSEGTNGEFSGILAEELQDNSGSELISETTSEVKLVKKLTLNPGKAITVGFDSKKQLNVVIEPEDATSPGLEWSAADASIAEVDEHGVIYGMKPGKTRVTVKATDGSRALAQIDVIVSSVYTESNEITINTPEEARVPVRFEGRTISVEDPEEWDFEADYLIQQEGDGFSWSVDVQGDTAVFTLQPVAAAEENHLIIQDKRNNQYQTDILVHVEDDAIIDAQKLLVEKAELLSGTGVLAYKFEIRNYSSQEIGEISYIVDYRDKFGDTYYVFSNTDGTLQNYSYTNRITINPGESLQLTGYTEGFRSDDLIEEVRLAINYYRYTNTGERVYIPDSQLYWYSSKTGIMPRPEYSFRYIQPDEDTTDLADRITYNLRATTCDLYSYVVKRFSRSKRPGKYVALIGDGGWAQKWGLQVQDVIYGADDLLWTDDPFFLNRVFAKVYNGETVQLRVVRNGEEIEIPISRNSGEKEEQTDEIME